MTERLLLVFHEDVEADGSCKKKTTSLFLSALTEKKDHLTNRDNQIGFFWVTPNFREFPDSIRPTLSIPAG
jgi:hypothetical protein